MFLSSCQLSVMMLTNLVFLLFWDVEISCCRPQLLVMYFVIHLAFLCILFCWVSIMGPTSVSGWLGVLVRGSLLGPFVHRLVSLCTFAYFFVIIFSSSFTFFYCVIRLYCYLGCSFLLEVFYLCYGFVFFDTLGMLVPLAFFFWVHLFTFLSDDATGSCSSWYIMLYFHVFYTDIVSSGLDFFFP